MFVFWNYKKKFLLLCLIAFAVILIFATYLYLPFQFYARDSIFCYRIKDDSLPDISMATPKKGKSIFFHETSCNSFLNGKLSIAPRQACAVESAAKMNPNMDVYLLFTSPGKLILQDTESDKMLQALLSYKNVNIMHLDYEKYIQGSPVEHLYQNGLIENSDYAQSHASDVLRYLTLWKYGGIYLDLDVIVIKSLEDLHPNYAGAESDANVAAGVLNFSPIGQGHQLAKNCLNDLKDHFDGHNWGNNGPGVITRLLRSICGVKRAKDMFTKDCEGFSVYPRDYFYPVAWWDWKLYFNENTVDKVMNMTKNTYVIHVWNKHSTNTKLPVSSKAAYVAFAKKYCPKVIAECKEVF